MKDNMIIEKAKKKRVNEGNEDCQFMWNINNWSLAGSDISDIIIFLLCIFLINFGKQIDHKPYMLQLVSDITV